MDLRLVAITTSKSEMQPYMHHEFCKMVFEVYSRFYPKVGFDLPWVGYFALHERNVVGVGGFKGAPQNNCVEIGYGTIPEKEGKGYATAICRELVGVARKKEPHLIVTARTLMEESASTAILKKNGFLFKGIVKDPEDGNVWEWVFKK